MSESRRAAAIGCALMVLLFCPAARADASTVATQPDALLGMAIAITAAPGEANHVGVSYDVGTTLYTITDSAGTT